jgi:NADPH-dependent 7-cyano-7-deazaguanine reductase QueF-like protein
MWATVSGRRPGWQAKEEVARPKKGIVSLCIYTKKFKLYLNEFNQKMAFMNWKIFK